jgi:hypothetical protein
MLRGGAKMSPVPIEAWQKTSGLKERIMTNEQ